MKETKVRDRLLESAAQCFLESDYRSVTTRLIAKRAGTNPAMIAYYFQSKAGLFEAVIKYYFSNIYQSLDAMSESRSLEAGLRTSWGEYFRVMSQKPELPRLMIRAMVYKDVPGSEHVVDNVLGKKMDTFCRVLREHQKSGTLRTDVSPRSVWVICAAIAMMPVVFDEIVERLLPGDSNQELDNIAETAAAIFAKGLER